jgi:hypothetical protein
VEYDRRALKKSLGFVNKFAGIEGLDAHGKSVAIRVAGASGTKKK